MDFVFVRWRLNLLLCHQKKHGDEESQNLGVIYAGMGSEAMNAARILRSSQNDSIVQDHIDRHRIDRICSRLKGSGLYLENLVYGLDGAVYQSGSFHAVLLLVQVNQETGI